MTADTPTHSDSATLEGSIHANILRLSEGDVFQNYQLVKLIGEGSMGSVSKVRLRNEHIGGSAFREQKKGIFGTLFHRKKPAPRQLTEPSDREHFFALKSIILEKVNPIFLQEMNNEIEILRNCDHANIVKLYEVYRNRRQIYLLMELCDGGDLYTRQPYSEREAARITSKICSAVKYMHDHGIVHRDLKLENIMFVNNEPRAIIKIIDYGLSKKFKGQLGYMHERVGTIYTMAPQVLQGVYSSRADMWAIGVITYALLSSSKPFFHKYRRKMIDLIMRADYNYEKPVWTKVTDDAKDFINKLLIIDPKMRMSSGEALKHPWIVNRKQLDDEKPNELLLKDVEESLLLYKDSSLIKKLALNVIAHRSNTKEIADLRLVFEKYDRERNGTLSFQEFQEALEMSTLQISHEELKEIFNSIDINNQGKIYWTEFLAATVEAHGHIAEIRIAEAFDRLDSDGSGYISKKNIKELLGSEATPKMVDDIIRAADTDRDGKISYQEFLEVFRKEADSLARRALRQREISSCSDGRSLVGIDAKIPGGIDDKSWVDSINIGEMDDEKKSLPKGKA